MFDKVMRGDREANAAPGWEAEPAVPTVSRPEVRVRNAAVIGPSIHIKGDLRGQEDLIIQGEVHGTIQLKDNSLTVGSEGKVFADVYAKSVVVEGKVEGNLFGSEHVAIKRSADIVGNIVSPRVSLEDGGRFKGKIEMDDEEVRKVFGGAPPGKLSPLTAVSGAGAAGSRSDEGKTAPKAASDGDLPPDSGSKTA
jgi:cytoskeletal protein CcmA (bactofilin family)